MTLYSAFFSSRMGLTRPPLLKKQARTNSAKRAVILPISNITTSFTDFILRVTIKTQDKVVKFKFQYGVAAQRYCHQVKYITVS
jgi:hypothetical protein